MPSTLDYLAQATSSAGADANRIRFLEELTTSQAQTIKDQAARIEELENGTTPPAPGIKPPAAPALPANSQVVHTGGDQVTGNVDYGGKMLLHIPAGAHTSIITLGKQGGIVRRVRIGTVPRDKLNPGKPPSSYGINMIAPGTIAEDVDSLDNGGFGIFVRGNNSIVRRYRARTLSDYPIFVEGVSGVQLEDIDIWDDNDTPSDPTDDDGGSWAESCIRVTGGGGTMKRVRVIYRGKARKACVRGDGIWSLEDCLLDGAISGVNPLDGGDGGQGWFFDTVFGNVAPWILHAVNTTQARKAMNDAINLGITDIDRLIQAWLQVARFEVNGQRYNPTPADIAETKKRRADAIGQRSAITCTRTHIKFGLAWKAGVKYTFDDTCTIEGTAENGGNVFGAIFEGEYPPVGFRLPGETRRPAMDITLDGTKLIGSNGLNNLSTDARKSIKIRGNVTLNGQPVVL